MSVPLPSLLGRLQPLIERTWDLETGIPDAAAFVIGDEALTLLGGSERLSEGDGNGGGARVLLHEHPEGVALALYYPDALASLLQRENPLLSVHPGNVDALAVLIEELDHLLVLASRVHRHSETSLLELELHANITKDLVIRHLLGVQLRVRVLPLALSRWVRFHLFEKNRFAEKDPGVRCRYEHARRLALGVLNHLALLPPAGRIAALRRLDRAGPPRLARGLGLVA